MTQRATSREWNRSFDEAHADWASRAKSMNHGALANKISGFRVALATTAGTHTTIEAAQTGAILALVDEQARRA